jgi:type IV secretion system protein VirD4
LDEFGNVGRLPGIAEKLTVSAGRGIRFLLAVQSLAQIDHIYGPQVREIITGNCDTTLFLRAADEQTAAAISRKAGMYTVTTTTLQRRAGMGIAGVSGSEGATGRPLLTPDEVLRWPLGEALILQAGQYPARLPLADLSAWRAASAAFQPAAPTAVRPVAPPPTWCPGADGTLADAQPEQPEQVPIEEVVPAAPEDGTDTEPEPVPTTPTPATSAAANRSAFRR